ncbi:MAG: DNA-processing protein DprA [Leptospiraceae bacterium]|nr:DNA-processing protein DprA [Leptospiraceae bacterium]
MVQIEVTESFVLSDRKISSFLWKYELLNKLSSSSEVLELVRKIFSKDYLELVQAKSNFELGLIQKHNINILTYFSKDYPELLKEIYNPPLVLFYKGNIKVLKEKLIAVVGTRKPSKISLDACEELPKYFSSENASLVSGIALGIDRKAMFSCLEKEIPVVGVMGTGFDKEYPRENKDLYQALKKKENTIIITENRFHSPIGKWSFPERNRIITGLCKALIIMESPLKSGAMSSATHAISQNRDIYVFDSENSLYNEGGRSLLRDGANEFLFPNSFLQKSSKQKLPESILEMSEYLVELGRK